MNLSSAHPTSQPKQASLKKNHINIFLPFSDAFSPLAFVTPFVHRSSRLATLNCGPSPPLLLSLCSLRNDQ